MQSWAKLGLLILVIIIVVVIVFLVVYWLNNPSNTTPNNVQSSGTNLVTNNTQTLTTPFLTTTNQVSPNLTISNPEVTNWSTLSDSFKDAYLSMEQNEQNLFINKILGNIEYSQTANTKFRYSKSRERLSGLAKEMKVVIRRSNIDPNKYTLTNEKGEFLRFQNIMSYTAFSNDENLRIVEFSILRPKNETDTN